MDVFEAIHKRKSVRAYAATPIPKEVLERILEAGRLRLQRRTNNLGISL